MASLKSISLELKDDLTQSQLESLKNTFESRLDSAEKARNEFAEKRDAAQRGLDFAIETRSDVIDDLNAINQRLVDLNK